MDAFLRASVTLICLSGGATLLLWLLFGAWPRFPRLRATGPAKTRINPAAPGGLSPSLGCLHRTGDYRSLSSPL